ncbi:MAG: helix-turn-helix transcriptional regulator [Caulobacterales bacterium]
MSLDEHLLGVVDLAYQAALEPELWPNVLQGVADCVETRRAVLLWRVNGREGGLGSTRLDPAVPGAYFQDYKTINPIQEQIDRHGRRQGACTDRHYVDKTDLIASDFYDRFLRPTQMHAFMMMPLYNSKKTTLNVIRDASEGEFEAREIEIGTMLLRPLGNAFDMSLRLDAERRVRGELVDLIQRQAGAVFLVDRDGAIVYANAAGEAMVRAGDGLSAPGKVLRAAASQAQAALARLVGLAASPDRQSRAGGVVSLPRPSGRRPLAALITPARGEMALTVPGGPLALVSVTDPETTPLAPGDQLRELFGFTAAEARVAAEFAPRHQPAVIAHNHGHTLHTRRVHIARNRAKTHTNPPGEFIALVLRSLGGPAWPREG